MKSCTRVDAQAVVVTRSFARTGPRSRISKRAFSKPSRSLSKVKTRWAQVSACSMSTSRGSAGALRVSRPLSLRIRLTSAPVFGSNRADRCLFPMFVSVIVRPEAATAAASLSSGVRSVRSRSWLARPFSSR